MLLMLLIASCAGLARLGFWQLDRATEKRARYDAFVARHSAAPLDFATLPRNARLADHVWRKTRAHGHFLELYVLLDNRSQHERPGYEVLTPFALDDGRTVLVDRGWVPLPASRADLPDVLAPSDPTTIGGYIGAEPTVGISLSKHGDTAEIMSPQIYRVQRVDLDGLASMLRLPLWPGVIYLDADALGALAVDWPLPGDDSGRSSAYAVQWFVMALVLAGLGGWNLHGRRRR